MDISLRDPRSAMGSCVTPTLRAECGFSAHFVSCGAVLLASAAARQLLKKAPCWGYAIDRQGNRPGLIGERLGGKNHERIFLGAGDGVFRACVLHDLQFPHDHAFATTNGVFVGTQASGFAQLCFDIDPHGELAERGATHRADRSDSAPGRAPDPAADLLDGHSKTAICLG
jgi:hypothetical protein